MHSPASLPRDVIASYGVSTEYLPPISAEIFKWPLLPAGRPESGKWTLPVNDTRKAQRPPT